MFASLLLAIVLGQSNAREVHSDSATYQGHTASAPIPPSLHVRNEGGRDGAGLCVISSILANGAYQGVADLGSLKDSKLWKTAKSRNGGYWPERLEKLVQELYPGEKWASFYGGDADVLTRAARDGLPIGATMNTGERYNWAPIAHMISLLDHTDGLACVVDNNFPGEYTWMRSDEFDRRWRDSTGNGWAFVWKSKRDDGGAPESPALPEWALASVVLVGAAGAILLATVAGARVTGGEV